METVKHVGKVIFLLEEIVKSNSKLQLQTNKMMIFIAWKDKELYVLTVLMAFISTSKKINVNKLIHYVNLITKILDTVQTVIQDIDYQEQHVH